MKPETLLEAVARKKADQLEASNQIAQDEKQFTIDQFKSVADAMAQATTTLIGFLKTYETNTKINNFPTKIATPDADKVVKAVKGLEKSLKPQTVDNTDVIEAISALQTVIKTMPENMPHTEAVEVTNLSEMTTTLGKQLESVLKALKGLEMKPVVNVPAPVVNVPQTDVKGIIKALKEVKQEVIDKPVPGVSVTPTDPLIRFTQVDIDDSGPVEYYSYLATSGEYYIRKVDKTGAYTTVRFYFGNGGATPYAIDWTGRAGLTYTLWST